MSVWQRLLAAFSPPRHPDAASPVPAAPAPAPGPLRVSPKGIVALAVHEGIVPAPYLDSVGVWTWGVGHTAAAGEPIPERMPRGMPKALDAAINEALRVFRDDLAKYERRVRSAVVVPLAQHQFDALVSFDFNTGGIHRAQLTRAINAGEPDAARHFFGWLRPPELRGRRTDEHRLFTTGVYPDKPVPIWRADDKGKVRGIHSHIGQADLLRRMGVA